MPHLPHPTRRRLAAGLVAAATVAALLPGSPGSPASAAPPELPKRVRHPRPERTSARCRRSGGRPARTTNAWSARRTPSRSTTGTRMRARSGWPSTGCRPRGPVASGRSSSTPAGPVGPAWTSWRGWPRGPAMKDLRRHFDLVGFDPRGTNRSTPSIACEPVARSVRSLRRGPGPSGRCTHRRRRAAGGPPVRGELPATQRRPAAVHGHRVRRPRHGPAARGRRRRPAHLPRPLLRHLPRRGVRRPVPEPGPRTDPRRVGRPVPARRRLPRDPGRELPGQRAVVDAFLPGAAPTPPTAASGRETPRARWTRWSPRLDDRPLTRGQATSGRRPTATPSSTSSTCSPAPAARRGRRQGGCWRRSPPASRSSPTPTCSAPSVARPTSSSSAPTPPAAWSRRTSSASPAAAGRWPAARAGPGLRAAQLRRRQRRGLQLLAAEEPAERLAGRLPGPGRRPGARGGVGRRPVHAVLRCRRTGRHPRQRPPAHRGRWSGRHAHVVLRQLLHPGQVTDYLVALTLPRPGARCAEE